MKPPRAVYKNPTGADIVVEIGEVPGEKPNRWECKAGKTVEGPANYADAFARHGLVIVERIEPTIELPSDRGLTRGEAESLKQAAEARFAVQAQEIRRLTDALDGAEKHVADLTKERDEAAAKADAMTKERDEAIAKLEAAASKPPKK